MVCAVARITPYIQAIQSNNTEKGAIMGEQGAGEEEPNSCSTVEPPLQEEGVDGLLPHMGAPWSCGAGQSLLQISPISKQGSRQNSKSGSWKKVPQETPPGFTETQLVSHMVEIVECQTQTSWCLIVRYWCLDILIAWAFQSTNLSPQLI